MQKRHQQKTAEARRERSQLEIQSERLAADLSVLATSDVINERLVEVEAQHEELQRASEFVALIARNILVINQATSQFNHDEAASQTLSPLNCPPALTETENLTRLIEQLRETQNEFDIRAARAQSLTSLPLCPDTEDEQPLAHCIRELRLVQTTMLRMGSECNALFPLSSPPALENVQILRDAIREIESTQHEVAASITSIGILNQLLPLPQQVDETTLAGTIREAMRSIATLSRIEAVHTVFLPLAPMPTLTDVTEMARLIDQIKGSHSAFNSHESAASDCEILLKDAEKQLRQTAESNGVCSACGAPLDADRLIARACSAGERHV